MALQQQKTLPPLYYLHDPRTFLRQLPPPYNAACTPHGQAKDFAPLMRYELELMQPRKLKFRACKVIFVGDCAVGKTAIVNRFCYDKFQSNYKATIGVDFEIENFTILGQSFSLEMWDTAGQERFKCIAGAYYRNANVVVVTFDMSKRETLDSAKKWLSSALAHNSTTQPPLVFLVGTKSDLLTKEEFMRMERLATNAATDMKAEYWSVSARSGYKVVEFFQRLAALAFEEALKQQLGTKQKDQNRQRSTFTPQMLSKSENIDLRKLGNGGETLATTKPRSGCAC